MRAIYSTISRSLSGRMLGHALALIRPWAFEFGEPYTDRLQSILHNYQYVSDYYMSGNDDPQRQDVVDMLVRDTYLLLDELYLRKRQKESSSFEFAEMNHATISFSNPEDAFRFFWLRNLQEWDLDSLSALVANPEMQDESLLAVSGLTLNLLRSFSLQNLLCLIKIAGDSTTEDCVKERAWVGLMLVFLKYDERLRFFPELVGAFQDLLDTEEGRVYSRTALTCLVRTLGVEWATDVYNNFQEQVQSKISQFKPDKLDSQLTMEDLDDFNALLQDESGGLLCEPPVDMEKLQEQHLDMNYAMFSGMYTTPFFSEPYRWMLPFAPDYLPEEMRKYAAILDVFPIEGLCDSDKYAFISGVAGTGLVNGLKADDLIAEAPKDSFCPGEQLLCNAYVQQLYRFFNLNPWHFENPFELIPNLPNLQIFKILNPTAADKQITAGHCLACRAYKLAADTYALIADTIDSVEIRREYGISLQKIACYEEAVAEYNKALQQKPSEWLLRQLEYCYRKLHRYDDALEALTRLAEYNPDNTSYLFEKGKCLEHLELYAEALQQYFNVDLLTPNEPKVLRSIAWCSFMCDDFESATSYYQKLKATGSIKPVDNLNMGHLYFVMGERMEAMQAYQRCLMQLDGIKEFLSMFRPDRKFLVEKGLHKNDIYFMEDQLILLSSSMHK